MNTQSKGRLTLPTDTNLVEETLRVMAYLGADAIRDCDGTEFPTALKTSHAKRYATYYTTRKDNEWAKANPDEVQQCYIMTRFCLAESTTLTIPIMEGISEALMSVNTQDDPKRWWEVIDRTSGSVVDVSNWDYDEDKGVVVIRSCPLFHEFTVSFLAFLIWDPVHMYNSVVNNWTDVAHQITFDVRQPKTHAYSLKRLKDFMEANPDVDVIRFTTFFHQFTLIFDTLKREKYVDWYGYSASVSPYILEQFEKEVGYTFRPEYIIDQGYYNNQYRVPTKEFMDFLHFQVREVCKLAKEFVDIVHDYGKEAMMFLGDHWIGTEPFLDAFETIGLDAVVGSVGNGSTLRLISDIKGVKYTEGRFLPYFFPDTFNENGNPIKEARENWVTARRAILRQPINRIGYGGYLKLAIDAPGFIAYIHEVANEFRSLYDNIKGSTPYCVKTVAVLNAWGHMRAWGNHMVHHALYQKQNYSYAGVIEALSGGPYEVRFISFEAIKKQPEILESIDVIINVGGAGTAHSGGEYWLQEDVLVPIRKFIYEGGGFIGIGEPSAIQYQGHFFQLAEALGVEKETGFTLNYDKYNWNESPHYITADCNQTIDFGEGQQNIFAFEDTTVIVQKDLGVQLATHDYGKGRTVYISGLPYSHQNTRLIHRAILYSSCDEDKIYYWSSSNYNVEVHAYYDRKKYCIVNNTYEPQTSEIYKDDGCSFQVKLESNEMVWYDMHA